jgi:DNA (cytosine-5)-methyltransferase 1
VENSPLLVGRGLALVIGDFAEMGYDARWCVLGGCDAGAGYKGERLWCLASASACIRREGERKLSHAKHKKTASDRETDWFKRIFQGRTMPYVCREDHGMDNRMDRLKAIGNGQDPRVVKLAWDVLSQN